MAKNKSAWGLEIGAHAIKAIRLENNGGEATITDFACIPHGKPLTTPDVDVTEMTRLTIGQLMVAKNLDDQTVVMSLPGHSALARFAKLPPVEPKMIQNIVKFEAVQQIPFPIEDVEWDYQTFVSADNPEVEVGIFAVTKERIQEKLKLYAEFNLRPEIVTLGPLAVFNAMSYDLSLPADHKPVIILDIGTQSSDVVVADNSRCWIRTFPLGGTHFTEALVTAFKLSYGKADSLKANSATSQHARLMMQAMRPVFGDLVQEVQRSIGHYQMNHPESPLNTVLAVGSTFRIPGLRKFLGQQLNVEIERVDDFKRIRIEGREAADFSANSMNFVTAYGLALQGIGLSRISVNLAPVSGLKEKVWAAKNKWFIAAASIAVVGSAAMFAAPTLNHQYLEMLDLSKITLVIKKGEQLQSQLKEVNAAGNAGAVSLNMEHLLNERNVWPCIVNDAVQSTLSANPTDEVTATNFEVIQKIPAADRKRIVLENLSGKYSFDEAANKRNIVVTMNIEFANPGKKTFLKDSIQKWLRDNSDRGDKVPYIILPDSIALSGELSEKVMPGGSTGKGKDGQSAASEGDISLGDSGGVGGIGKGAGTNAGGDPNGGADTSGEAGSSGVASGSSGRGRTRDVGTKIKAGKANMSQGTSAATEAMSEATEPEPVAQSETQTEVTKSSKAGNATAVEVVFDLEKFAPIEDEPTVYGPGMTVYRGVIVFTVQLRDGSTAKVEGTPTS